MFDGPIRGGTRGGQGEFKWSDVSADKDRENYLGHSINAPTGRWQKNKDVHWYNRDMMPGETERQAEIRRIKEAEEEALAVALGFKPAVKPGDGNEGQVQSTVNGESTTNVETSIENTKAEKESKEERRARKEERRRHREEKRARKEARRARGHADNDEEGNMRRNERRLHSRSRSQQRRGSFSRSRSPPHAARRHTTPGYDRRQGNLERREKPRDFEYGGRQRGEEHNEEQREHERERDRAQWDERNVRRRRY